MFSRFYRGHSNSSPENPSCRSSVYSSWVHALFRVAAFRATQTSPTCCVRDSAFLSAARKPLYRAFSVARRRHAKVAPDMWGARRIFLSLRSSLSVSPAATFFFFVASSKLSSCAVAGAHVRWRQLYPRSLARRFAMCASPRAVLSLSCRGQTFGVAPRYV